MTYRIQGLDPAPFAHLYGLPDAELAALHVVRMAATTKPGAPCRITLEDAEPGESMLLVNHLSQPRGPYRATHAIFVREGAREPAQFLDETPPVFTPRILSLRAFDADAMMVDARLTQPGEADAELRQLFDNPIVAEIHVHNAVRGCFSAKVTRA